MPAWSWLLGLQPSQGPSSSSLGLADQRCLGVGSKVQQHQEADHPRQASSPHAPPLPCLPQSTIPGFSPFSQFQIRLSCCFSISYLGASPTVSSPVEEAPAPARPYPVGICLSPARPASLPLIIPSCLLAGFPPVNFLHALQCPAPGIWMLCSRGPGIRPPLLGRPSPAFRAWHPGPHPAAWSSPFLPPSPLSYGPPSGTFPRQGHGRRPLKMSSLCLESPTGDDFIQEWRSLLPLASSFHCQ